MDHTSKFMAYSIWLKCACSVYGHWCERVFVRKNSLKDGVITQVSCYSSVGNRDFLPSKWVISKFKKIWSGRPCSKRYFVPAIQIYGTHSDFIFEIYRCTWRWEIWAAHHRIYNGVVNHIIGWHAPNDEHSDIRTTRRYPDMLDTCHVTYFYVTYVAYMRHLSHACRATMGWSGLRITPPERAKPENGSYIRIHKPQKTLFSNWYNAIPSPPHNCVFGVMYG